MGVLRGSQICLALGVALLAAIASPSRSYEQKTPSQQLGVAQSAIDLVASAGGRIHPDGLLPISGGSFDNGLAGSLVVGVQRPDTLPGPVGGGSGVSGAGAGNVTAGTGGPGVPGEVPPEFVATKPLSLPRVDVSTPQGGIGALLGGGASVSLPDWSQLHIVPGGISANDLALNLSGQFVNRGQFEVGNSLIIAAAGGIDNFGAGIQAGGVMRLSGGGLNNEQGRIEAGSLLTSIQGDIANSRGAIVAHNGGYLQADGNIAATDGRFTSDAGKIVLDAGGSIVLDASQVKGKTGAGLYAGGDIRLGTTAKTTSSDERSAKYETFVTYNGDMETREETRVQTGESRTRQSSTVHTGTVIDGGEGSTTLRATGDVVALGAQIKAQQDVLIQGANVRVEAVKDRALIHE
ncbi:Haemagluttinin repeat-containing protein, partial [Paracidovorax valerianellae]